MVQESRRCMLRTPGIFSHGIADHGAKCHGFLSRRKCSVNIAEQDKQLGSSVRHHVLTNVDSSPRIALTKLMNFMADEFYGFPNRA